MRFDTFRSTSEPLANEDFHLTLKMSTKILMTPALTIKWMQSLVLNP